MNFRFLILTIICCLITSCSQNQQIEERVIFVKVPPFYDKNLTQEENYWNFRHFLFPQEEIPKPIPKGLSNDNSLLYVSVDENGNIKINSQNEGDISKTSFLTERLAEVFKEREKNGLYEINTSDSFLIVESQ